MRNKNLLMAVIVIVIFLIGALVVGRLQGKKGPVQKPAVAKSVKDKAQPKKVFAKGMGSLTVMLQDSKGKPMALRIQAFRTDGSKISNHILTSATGRAMELPAGTYDVVFDTSPAVMYKGVRVSESVEKTEDAGCMTGSVFVRARDAKMKEARYAVRVRLPNLGSSIAAGSSNRPIEVMKGVYDIEVGTTPVRIFKGVKVTACKETGLDIKSVPGILVVKAFDEEGKTPALTVKAIDPATKQSIIVFSTTRAVEILEGKYDIELISKPPQLRKDIEVRPGEETRIDFTVQAQVKKTASASAKK